MNHELKCGYRVKSNAEESWIYSFAESELIIPNIPVHIPNRTDIAIRNIKIDFPTVSGIGGFDVQIRYSNLSGSSYNHLCGFTSDDTTKVDFSRRIDDEYAVKIIEEYHKYMDSMLCLEQISIEEMLSKRARYLESLQREIRNRNLHIDSEDCSARPSRRTTVIDYDEDEWTVETAF